MSDQQRLLITMLLCMGVFFTYNVYLERTTVKKSPVAASSPGEAPPPAPGPDRTPLAAVPLPPATEAQQVPAASRNFSTPLFVGTLRNQGAAITALTLNKFADHVPSRDEKKAGAPPPRLSLVSREPTEAPLPQATLGFFSGDTEHQVPLRFVGPQSDDGSATMVLGGQNGMFAVQVRVQPRQDAYAIDYDIAVRNVAATALPLGARVKLALSSEDQDEDSGFLSGKAPGSGLRAFCMRDEDIERRDLAALRKKSFEATGKVRFAGLDRQYFVVTAVPKDDGVGGGCELIGDGNLVQAVFDLGKTTLGSGDTWQTRFALYAGPKLDEEFERVSPSLKQMIEYNMWYLPLGALARPMLALLDAFHGFSNSWGVAIILLTVLVKLLLLPLSYKGAVSMRKMQALKPELDKIRNKFPGDRERQSSEQMKLYRERGINPLGGCLPTLLQIPVGLALYRMLWSAVHLYHQSFLWLPDLTAKEPLPILAVLLGVITIAQQKLTPMNMDASQAKVFTYMMPVMLTVFMINLPSGLVLYILVNSILTIVQQLVINSRAASTS